MKILQRTLSVAVLTVLLHTPCASAETFLYLTSQPGDYIGQGRTRTFTPADGTFRIQGTAQTGIHVAFNTPGFESWWYLDFVAPKDQALARQEYEGAQRYPFQSPRRPGLSVTGEGRGCNTLTGRFLVADVSFAPDGIVTSFAIDFEQHCEGFRPALYGSMRFNSDLAAVPRVSVGDVAALKGNAGTNNSLVTFSLSLPSGDPVTVQFSTEDDSAVDGTDYVGAVGAVTFEPGTTASAVSIALLGDRLPRGDKAFHVRLLDTGGAPPGQDLATVSILDPNIPMTVLAMYGQPGDYINPGLFLATTSDGAFRARRNFHQGVEILLDAADPWVLDFAAADSAPLAPGVYENARRFPFEPPGLPGLDVYGAGRGCNTLTGRFVVSDVTYLPDGGVDSFAGDLEQHCEGLVPALFASVRINSTLRQFSVSNAVISDVDQTATFTITINPAPDDAASVAFMTADGTARAGTDYTATAQTVHFGPGDTEQTVVVPLLEGSGLPGRFFFGRITAPQGAPVWISQGSAIISGGSK